jgi:hypothetical protein
MYMVCNYNEKFKEKCSHYKLGEIVYAEKEPRTDQSRSHGICKECYKLEMSWIETEVTNGA